MNNQEQALARRLLAAESKIEMLDKELYAHMAITAFVLAHCFDNPHQLLASLRADTNLDDEQAAIDAVAALLDNALAVRDSG